MLRLSQVKLLIFWLSWIRRRWIPWKPWNIQRNVGRSVNLPNGFFSPVSCCFKFRRSCLSV